MMNFTSVFGEDIAQILSKVQTFIFQAGFVVILLFALILCLLVVHVPMVIITLPRMRVGDMLKTLDLRVEYNEGKQVTMIDGEDVSLAIRENVVSMAASDISAHHAVRIKMVEMQREIAKRMSCVLDGRDIGSAVLPDAKFKFFITADSKVRAKRRYDELTARGEVVDFDKLHAEIVARDKQDSEREFSPLVCAEDAMVIDTSCMDVNEVVLTIKKAIQSKI